MVVKPTEWNIISPRNSEAVEIPRHEGQAMAEQGVVGMP
jgi:hypothetical protein